MSPFGVDPARWTEAVPRPPLRAQVRVPDGREGDVLGFYSRERESILVVFPSGDCAEFPNEQLERLDAPVGFDRPRLDA